jgi:hypothetical protein
MVCLEIMFCDASNFILVIKIAFGYLGSVEFSSEFSSFYFIISFSLLLSYWSCKECHWYFHVDSIEFLNHYGSVMFGSKMSH